MDFPNERETIRLRPHGVDTPGGDEDAKKGRRRRRREKVLLAAWQGAHKVEGTDDQSLFVSKSADGGATWTKARVVPGRKFGVRWAPTFFSSGSSSSGSGGGETTYLFYAESEKCWHCESGECEDIVRKRKSGSEEEDVSVYWDESKEGIVSKAKKAASVGPWWRPGGEHQASLDSDKRRRGWGYQRRPVDVWRGRDDSERRNHPESYRESSVKIEQRRPSSILERTSESGCQMSTSESTGLRLRVAFFRRRPLVPRDRRENRTREE